MKSSVIFIFLSVITSQGRFSPQQSGRIGTSNIQHNIGECREGSAWSQACNTCICLNGRNICTDILCGTITTTSPTTGPSLSHTSPPPQPPTSQPTTRPSLGLTSALIQLLTSRSTSSPTSGSTQPSTPHPTRQPTPRPTSYPTVHPASTSSRPGEVRPSVAVSGLGLWKAARAGEVSAVVAQLAAGADVNWVNQDQWRFTALHMAAYKNHPDVVRVLLDEGAPINAQGSDGRTPIALASFYGSSSALGLLISRGADVNLSDRSGSTPLHRAARNNYLGIVQQLLAAGADTTTRTGQGYTPGDLARRYGHPNLAATIDNSSPAALGPLTTA